MLTEFQKAKLIEWAEWCLTHGPQPDWMPCGIRMVDQWAEWTFIARGIGGDGGPFPTRDQFAERQNAVTSEAI